MFLKSSYSKISGKTCMVETNIIQVYSFQPGTLLKTDSITDIFWNYSQLLSDQLENCDQLPIELPRPLRANISPI